MTGIQLWNFFTWFGFSLVGWFVLLLLIPDTAQRLIQSGIHSGIPGDTPSLDTSTHSLKKKKKYGVLGFTDTYYQYAPPKRMHT